MSLEGSCEKVEVVVFVDDIVAVVVEVMVLVRSGRGGGILEEAVEAGLETEEEGKEGEIGDTNESERKSDLLSGKGGGILLLVNVFLLFGNTGGPDEDFIVVVVGDTGASVDDVLVGEVGSGRFGSGGGFDEEEKEVNDDDTDEDDGFEGCPKGC